MIKFLKHSYSNPYENVALEEVLLKPFIKEAGEDLTVRLWENKQTCVVLGRAEKADERVKLEQAKSMGVPVIRRVSGGGTVVHAEGNLNLSFFIPMDFHPHMQSIRSSYRVILSWVQNAIEKQSGVKPTFEGSSDLCVDHKKISGTAQARKRFGLLHHLTLLIDFDIDLVKALLNAPDKEPEYRQQRDHESFITSLKNEDIGFNRDEFVRDVLLQLGESEEISLSPAQDAEVKNLVEKKYSLNLWNIEGKNP